MAFAPPGSTPLAFTSRAPTIIVLGNDAVLAALPATPVQLAHACTRMGYQHVVPGSWGDELVAGAVLRTLEERRGVPAVQCSCPLVAHRLLSVGTELRPFLISLVPPPVALARYLRASYGATQLRITYVGACPGATDDSINERLTPEQLLALFAERKIALFDQPQVFDSVIPPDRRRHLSQPGGVPTPETLWTSGGNRTLEQLHGENLPVELAQLLLTEQEVLVDPSASLGCACAGGGGLVHGRTARAELQSLEPPRSLTPIVDARVTIDFELPFLAPPPIVEVPTPLAPPVPHASRVHDTHVHPTPPHSPPIFELPSFGIPAARTAAPPPADAERVPPTREERQPAASGNEPELVALEPDPIAASHAPPVVAPAGESMPFAAAPSLLPPRGPHRRSPVHGVPRTVQGEVPMARHADGRHLPRTYVLRRRHVLRAAQPTALDAATLSDEASRHTEEHSSVAVIDHVEDVGVEEVVTPGELTAVEPRSETLGESETVGESETSTVASGPETTPAASAPTDPVVDEATLEPPVAASSEEDRTELTPVTSRLDDAQSQDSRQVAAPGPTIISVAPPLAAVEVGIGGSATQTVELPIAPPEPPMRPVVRPAEIERARDTERPVELPMERHSDSVRKSPVGARLHAQPAPEVARAAGRPTWVMIVLIVALVAIVSSAIGAAIGAWVTAERTSSAATR